MGSADVSKGAKHLIDTNPGLKAVPTACIFPDTVLSEPVTVESVPIIDISGLDDPDRRSPTVAAVTSACAEWGFFIMVNHGFDPTLKGAMMAVVDAFFDLPLESKLVHASTNKAKLPVEYGSSLGAENGLNARNWRDFLTHFGRPFDKSNFHVWPVDPPAYRDVAREYLENIWKLTMRVASAISEGLELGLDYIEGVFGEGSQFVALNYYPPCPEPHKTLGISCHTDRGGMTIVMDNGINGLQVRRQGKWIQVPHVPGCFMVILGDCMERLTNGRYKSVEHRALVNEQWKRITVAVGNGPGHEEIIQPASHLVDQEGGQPKYMPVVFKELRFKGRIMK